MLRFVLHIFGALVPVVSGAETLIKIL